MWHKADEEVMPSLRLCVVTLALTTVNVAGIAQHTHPAVTLIDASGLKQLVEDHRGSVLLINMWATWCVPCVDEFPNLIRFRSALADRGLVMHFVSLDRARSIDTHLRPFLRRMGVDFQTYLKKAGNDELFINVLSSEWSGALPATFIYDRSGDLKHLLVGEQTPEELQRFVEPLMNTND